MSMALSTSLNFMVLPLALLLLLPLLVAAERLGNAPDTGSMPAAAIASFAFAFAAVASAVAVATCAASFASTGSCDTISSFILISVWSSMVSSMYVFRIISRGMLSRMLSRMHSLIIISISLVFFCDDKGGMPRSNKYTLV